MLPACPLQPDWLSREEHKEGLMLASTSYSYPAKKTRDKSPGLSVVPDQQEEADPEHRFNDEFENFPFDEQANHLNRPPFC